MKYIVFMSLLLALIVSVGCSDSGDTDELEAQIDSLQDQIVLLSSRISAHDDAFSTLADWGEEVNGFIEDSSGVTSGIDAKISEHSASIAHMQTQLDVLIQKLPDIIRGAINDVLGGS